MVIFAVDTVFEWDGMTVEHGERILAAFEHKQIKSITKKNANVVALCGRIRTLFPSLKVPENVNESGGALMNFKGLGFIISIYKAIFAIYAIPIKFIAKIIKKE
jgi:hypothetical protein